MDKGTKETEISYWYTRKAGNQKTEKKKVVNLSVVSYPHQSRERNGQVKSLLSAKKQSKPWFEKPNGKMGEEPHHKQEE